MPIDTDCVNCLGSDVCKKKRVKDVSQFDALVKLSQDTYHSCQLPRPERHGVPLVKTDGK